MEKLKETAIMAANNYRLNQGLAVAQEGTRKNLDDLLNQVVPPDNIEQEAMSAFGNGQDGPVTWDNGIPKGKILDKKTNKLRDMTNKEKASKFLKEAVEGKEAVVTISGIPTFAKPFLTTS